MSTNTPNVVITNPKARKIIGNTFGWLSLGITAVTIVDAAIDDIDLLWFTGPAAAIVMGLFGLYQTTVTSKNVPSDS